MSVEARAEGAVVLPEGLVDDAGALLAAALPGEELELSLLVVDDAVMAALNGQWRGEPHPTDVLSFPQQERDGSEHGHPASEGALCLGDLVIALPTASRQAAERGHGLREELRVLLVHGLLHLLGYDHEAGPEELAEMADAEGRLLGHLGWSGVGLVAASEGGR